MMSDPGLTDAIVVPSEVRPSDSFRVATMLVLRNRLSVALMTSGPALWALGTIGRSAALTSYGARMSWIIVLLPVFAALMGSYTAYRPGVTEIHEPATWTFTPEGIDIAQPARHARAEWDEFVSWRLVEGCFLLHTDARRYVTIAGRALTAAERFRLETLLDEKLGHRRR